ncbi:MAG: NrpR regulatory domain-containing protein [Deltaproteobacteria bacterium]|nr:NrpR regulatory domain-containing protein [Deltaproteobacteria bacterium]
MKKLFDPEEIERKIVLILQILKDSGEPVGARLIARRMQDFGVTLSERAVRYHLKIMDEKGLTRLVSRREGRIVTDRGVDEVSHAMVQDKVGLAISRIEILAYRTTFDPVNSCGVLPVNISLFPKDRFKDALKVMRPAFDAGIAVSDLVAVARENGQLGSVTVPAGKVGLATVCSIVINGVLLKAGIPMDSKFAGILQMKDRKPRRFVELIYYSGSSLDPSETFIMAKMTSVRSVLKQGEGNILANFREIPAPCKTLVEELVFKLNKVRIGGVLSIGEVSEPVCQVHVDLNKVGLILTGGLNPIACAQEAGIQTENRGMAAVMDFQDLRKFSDIYRGI